MLPWLGQFLTEVYGPFRLFTSRLFLAGLGTALAAIVTWYVLPRFWHRLPTDQGRAFAIGAQRSKGKPVSAGIIFVPIFVAICVLITPFDPWRLLALACVFLAMLEGYLDVLIRYRGSILALMRDVSSTPRDFYERMVRFGEHANELISGPNADLDERIRAAQALSALGDPLILFYDIPSEELRDRILGGAWRLLDEPIDPRRAQ